MDFAFEDAALHRLADGGAHRRNVKRLVDVITGAEPERLPDGVGRLERRHHDRLHFGLHVFQALQNLDARHAGHADVQHRHVNVMFLRQLNRRRAVLGHEQVVVVLENYPQRLARAVFVVHNQQRAALFGGRGRLTEIGHRDGGFRQWVCSQGHVGQSGFSSIIATTILPAPLSFSRTKRAKRIRSATGANTAF